MKNNTDFRSAPAQEPFPPFVYEEALEAQASYPLTDNQLGMYLECVQSPQDLMYNLPFRLCFPPEMGIEADKLCKALTQVVNAYPSLKIHFAEEGGQPRMIANPSLGVAVARLSCEGKTDDELAREFIVPFDLFTGPLFRFALYQRGDTLFLLMDIHHLLTDGTSFTPFLHSLSCAYQGTPLPAQPISAFALSLGQKRFLASPQYAQCKNYYNTLLAGVEVDSTLPTDNILPENLTPGVVRTLRVPLSTLLNTQALEKGRKELGLRKSALFLSAFAYALAKTTGQTQALFSTIVQNRNQPELQNTIGLLVRNLPIYAPIDEATLTHDYLLAMQAQLENTKKYNACALMELVATHSLSTNVLFVYQGALQKGVTLQGHPILLERLETHSNMVDFALDVYQKENDYELCFEYRTNLYQEATIQGFAQLMGQVLQGLLQPGPLGSMPLCTAQDIARYQNMAGPPLEYPRALTMVDLLRQQCVKTPSAPAVVYQNTTLSYAQLDDLSERLALALTKAGVKPETPVGILVHRSERFPVCALGVLKAGGACLPLDANYPPERLRLMLEDSAAQVVLADEDLAPLLPGYQGKIIPTWAISTLPPGNPALLHAPTAQNLFALLYTSGSTGQPKGCMLTHANLVNFCLTFQRFFGVTAQDKTSAYGSLSFDASMQDFYPYLTAGACVYMVPEETRLDLAALHEFMLKNQITMADCTTQIGRQYVCAYPSNPYLKAFTVGGEKLVPCQPPQYPFYNTYGPTEATIYISHYGITQNYTSVPIGQAFGNCVLYIVDTNLRLLPPGVPGELCASGYPVTRGYLNQPALTAEKYPNNPFSTQPGYEKLYRTGDICRLLPNGQLQYVGRRDEQVKIRGFRIELTEIERRIRAFAGITDATVIARELPAGGMALAAYVVAAAPVDIAALNAFIVQKLPTYMVPASTTQVETIPLNPNGKVDKRRLPAPTVSPPSGENCTPHTLNWLEQQLVAMVEELAGQTGISLEQNLLHVGLSSLSMMQLSTRLHQDFGCQISVAELLNGSTLLSIENTLLQQRLTTQSATKAPPVAPAKALPQTLPLSSAQRGVYYGSMQNPSALIYNIPMLFSFGSNVHAQQLASAVTQLLAARPLFNTHMAEENGVVTQRLSPGTPPQVALLQMQPEAFDTYKKEFVQPFSLHTGPLYRAAVVSIGQTVCLLLDVHHIIFDGLSLMAFMQALITTYETGIPPAEEASFWQAVAEETNGQNNAEEEDAKAYYTELFEEFESASRIPPNLGGKPEEGTLCECVAKTPPAAAAFCQQQGLTLAQLFLAAVCYTTARYTASNKVYLSTLAHGRRQACYQNCLGMFVKTLPLAATIQPEQTALQYLNAAAEALRSTTLHGQWPLHTLLQSYGYTPHINYACQLGLNAPLALGGAPVRSDLLALSLPKFDVSVHIETREEAPAICVQYNSALYSKDYMQGFASAIAACTASLMASPSQDISALSLLGQGQNQLLARFGHGEKAEIPTNLFHACFEKQAAQTPQKPALAACDGHFTYQQLNTAMNRIANALVSAGVKPQNPVVLLLPRTSRLIMAMYGVLKAGGVFIPVSDDCPEDRLRYILEDSAATHIIATPEATKRLSGLPVLDVETLLGHPATTPPSVVLTPHNAAYIIYTSGSTGKPKGVVLTHGGISNYVTNHPANCHVHAVATLAHTLVSVTTASFDMSLKETAVALCNGLCLALASEEEANNPQLLAALFSRTGGNAFNATPSRMAQYIGLPAFCSALAGCTVVMCGGESFPSGLLRRLQGITQAQIFNTYGPTEITVSCNAKNLTHESTVSIGTPLLNVKEWIMDSDANLLPPGAMGELWVGGAGVATGYLNPQPEAAAHFANWQGQRVYKTGDYARWLPNGDVAILGRADSQLKLRGLRIEPGEIEKTMMDEPRIKEAVVQVRMLGAAMQLCAWFTASASIPPAEIKAFLKKTLAPYMVPVAFCQLPALPLTPNGKLNVAALPLPALPQSEGTNESPCGKDEELLCQSFAKTLQMNEVSATGNFFELGGTSLMVTSLLIDASQQGLNISYGDVFQHPTPRALAALLGATAPTAGTEDGQNPLGAFDYAPINTLLASNTLLACQNGPQRPVGNLLLTGAGGYLGIHLLYHYLCHQKGTVYCLLRSKNGVSAEARLKTQLYYYFEDTFEALFGNRIQVVEADLTSPDWLPALREAPIDTIINSAALVKHFSAKSDLDDTNLGGVARLIEFCQDKNIRLIQISTGSVAGECLSNHSSPMVTLTEQAFYYGQTVDNQYVYSKFMAERLLLEAITNGLDAKIMRVGNLAARQIDGEFQINFGTNGFAGRLRAYCAIQAFPYSAMDTMVELAPVDSTSAAIFLLCQTPSACCIYHPSNNHYIPLGDIILQMKAMGLPLQLLEEEAYQQALQQAKSRPEIAPLLTPLLAYDNINAAHQMQPVAVDVGYTTKTLYRLGFSWPITSHEYMQRFLVALKGLGFFAAPSEQRSTHV